MQIASRVRTSVLVALLAFGSVPAAAQVRELTGRVAALSPPDGLTFNVTRDGLILSWRPVAEAAQYKVLRSKDAVTAGEELSRPQATTSFLTPAGSQSEAAFYAVVAIAADGRSATSVPVGYVPAPTRVLKNAPLGVAPHEVPLTPPTIEANYASPIVRWYGEAGITYEVRQSSHPGQPNYPPILIHRATQQTSGPATVQSPSEFQPAPVDLHEVTYFQLTSDNNQGQVRTSAWVPYQPTPHGAVTLVEGGYWEVPVPNGTRLVYACMLPHHVAGSYRTDVTVTRNNEVRGFWEGESKYWATQLMMIAVLAQGEVAGQIIGRVDPAFRSQVGNGRDTLHGLEIVLSPVQPMTECPANFGATR